MEDFYGNNFLMTEDVDFYIKWLYDLKWSRISRGFLEAYFIKSKIKFEGSAKTGSYLVMG